MKISGIILAGGKSSRINFNKIKIYIESIPLFIDTIFKISFFCNEIIISTSEENLNFIEEKLKNIKDYFCIYNFDNLKKFFKKNTISYNHLNNKIKIIKDIQILDDRKLNNKSALIGIYTGLLNTSNFYSFVIASDMPFISYKLINTIIKSKKCTENPDIILTENEKGFEALCGLYSKNCIKIIKKNIKNNILKISDIFPSLKTYIIPMSQLEKNGIDRMNFYNINTFSDYVYFQKEWAKQKKSYSEKWAYYFLR